MNGTADQRNLARRPQWNEQSLAKNIWISLTPTPRSFSGSGEESRSLTEIGYTSAHSSCAQQSPFTRCNTRNRCHDSHLGARGTFALSRSWIAVAELPVAKDFTACSASIEQQEWSAARKLSNRHHQTRGKSVVMADTQTWQKLADSSLGTLDLQAGGESLS